MRLPNARLATVPEAKLTRYLLDTRHPDGGPKARLLLAHGYDASAAAVLREGLLRVAREGVVVDVRETGYGLSYGVVGELRTPRGTTLRVRTAWMVEPGEEQPGFVTAYPEGPRPRPDAPNDDP